MLLAEALHRVKIHHLNSLERVEAIGGAWDELWQRSANMFPSTQSAGISQWMRHFASSHNFHAIAIQHNNKLQAALPLVEQRWKRVFSVASLPGNEWSPIGNLMLDWSDDSPTAITKLVAALDETRWSLLRFDPIRLDALQWRLLSDALKQSGHPLYVEKLFDVGQVDVDGDWTTYFQSRSRNLRKDLGKAWRRLSATGHVELSLHIDPNDAQLTELMWQGFEVENRSWKNRQGTSVLRTPRMLDYYTQQAALLRDRGQLQLSMLNIDGHPIAFEYGWHSHGTYYAFKVGYDETFERHSPGQLLRMKLIEHFFADDYTTTIDFFGPLNHALAAWSTVSFTIGRFIVGRPTIVGRTIVDTYRRLRSIRQRLRPDSEPLEFNLRPYDGNLSVGAQSTSRELVGQSLP